MAAELGETTDRTALVPGSPETVHGAASTLTTRGATLEAIGEAIGRVDTPGWFGEACSAFWDTFGQEKANWFTAADALTSAGTTLTGYAETLTWAQDQAQEAIDLWEQGEAATATARTSYNETLAEYRSMGLPDTELAPFDDPGTAKRTEAQTILTEARTTLVEAGDSAAAALRAGAGGEAGAPEWLATASQVAQDAIDEFGLSVTQDSWDIGDDGPVGDDDMRQWGDDTGDDDDQNKGPNWSVALWEAGADVALWEANAEGEIQLGDATLSGSAGVQFLSAEAGAEFSIGSDGLTMGANAGAYLLQANAEGSIQYGILEAGASGEVMVGAEASGDLSIGADGLHAGGEAFAGAKAEGTLSGDVGGVGGAITGEAWAGVGVAADLDIGMEDGKFVIGGELGAAIGVGGSISPEITIDPGEVVDTVSDAADAVGDIAGDVGDWAGDTFGGLF